MIPSENQITAFPGLDYIDVLLGPALSASCSAFPALRAQPHLLRRNSNLVEEVLDAVRIGIPE